MSAIVPIPCSKSRAKQGPLNSTAAILVKSALSTAMTHSLELKDVAFPTLVKADTVFLYSESEPNPIDTLLAGDSSLDLEEHFKTLSVSIASTINTWISGTAAVPTEVTELLTSYEYPAAGSLSELGTFSILKMKKKSNKGVEVSFGVSASNEAPKAKSTTPASASLANSTQKPASNAPVTIQPKRVNQTKFQAAKLIDKILPALLTHLSTDFTYSDYENISKLEQDVDLATMRLKIAGSKAKQNKPAAEKLQAARDALATVSEEKRAAYAKMKASLSADIVQELNMFKNEAYTAGVLSVKDRDRLAHNHRR